jgi:hypothetical protein
MNLYYLTIAVMVLAVAQVLTIFLTIGRDREIKQLRELITEQRIHIAELRAWISGRMQSAQSRRIKKPDREPAPEPTMHEPAKQPPPINTQQPTNETETEEDASKRMTKVIRWFKEDVDKAREVVAARQGKSMDKIK